MALTTTKYTPFLGGDGNYYYRKLVGDTTAAPVETLSSSFATVALLMADIRAKVFADTGFSEVQS